MKKLYFGFCLCLFTAITFGQNISFEQVVPLPPAPQNIADFINGIPFIADIDNDNDPDVMIIGSETKRYINHGSGSFTEVLGTPFAGIQCSSITFADIDNDNDQDVLVTGQNDTDQLFTKLYTNDGDGNFTVVVGTPFDGVKNSSIAYADIDNDNDQDVLITGQNNSEQPITKLYTNDGIGNYTELLGTPFVPVEYGSIAFADIDNDNDQDLLISGQNNLGQSITNLYTNDGNGNFIEIADTLIENAHGPVAFADVDNDSDQDFLIGSKLFTNDGSGTFTVFDISICSGWFFSCTVLELAFADIDNDNDLDILTGVWYSGWWDQSYGRELYINDGSGNFTTSTGDPFENANSQYFVFADIDNDNDHDALIGNRLFNNLGNGNFDEVTGSPFVESMGTSVAYSDVDNDNDLDVLITGGFPAPYGSAYNCSSILYKNDGIGNFSKVEGTPFEGVYDGSIAFADFDNDNDEDVLISGLSSTNGKITTLYTNDGSGNYTEVFGTPFEGVNKSSISIADIDNDNDLDVLLTGSYGNDWSNQYYLAKIYTNDGNGLFTELAGTPFEGVAGGSSAFADIDNDNDQDVLIMGSTPTTHIAKLYINDGSGFFTEVIGTPFTGGYFSSFAFADTDNDNDIDVLISGSGEDGILFTNDGSGNFTEVSGTPFEGVHNGSIAFADVDYDDDLDVLISGKKNGAQIEITKFYSNDGVGNFTEIAVPFEGVYDGSIAWADIDSDNDLDVIISGSNNTYGPTSKLYRNISSITTKIPEENTVFSDVSIYPNPSQGQTTIDLGGLNNVSINVYNVSGQLIYHKENVSDPTHQFELNADAGIYILEVSAQQQKQHYKLIIE